MQVNIVTIDELTEFSFLKFRFVRGLRNYYKKGSRLQQNSLIDSSKHPSIPPFPYLLSSIFFRVHTIFYKAKPFGLRSLEETSYFGYFFSFPFTSCVSQFREFLLIIKFCIIKYQSLTQKVKYTKIESTTRSTLLVFLLTMAN